MILEAFSKDLQEKLRRETTPSGLSSKDILHEWLTNILIQPQGPGKPTGENHVHCVIHTEIKMILTAKPKQQVEFVGRSPTGQRLLENLYAYCQSYDQWQFSRWLHHLKASDFPPYF